MKRSRMLEQLNDSKPWDLLIIGGGATGLGIAVDGASRGFRTLLIEQSDFAKGTSSRSTKLIHGGVRYLKQGNLKLVREALKERGLLFQNAPHLISHLPFLVPHYQWWEPPFYGIGLRVYDLLAGRLGIEKSEHLDLDETLLRIPNLHRRSLRGGTIYYDGQFDDARLALALAQTAADEGGCLLNYMPAIRLIKTEGRVKGVVARDEETKREYELLARVVISATGVFSDSLRKMDQFDQEPMIAPSQGIHLVLNRSFLDSDTAVMIPKTDDGRVLFFIPWLNHLLVGTTDTPVGPILLEPKPFEEEIEFLLAHAKRYLKKGPRRSDILSCFAGLRPLVKRKKGVDTASLSRDHEIFISPSGLITVAGGKWTTYRKMGQDAVDQAIRIGGLPQISCRTEHLRLHGYSPPSDSFLSVYGTEGAKIKQIGGWERPLHPALPYSAGSIQWAVREEMALHLEDVLARRTRALFLNAKAALEAAPFAARILAEELNKSQEWEKHELEQFSLLARSYRVD